MASRLACSGLWHLCSRVTVMCDGALLFWGWLSTCPPMESGEGIPYFALLVFMAFALPIELSLSQTMSFLTFTVRVPSSNSQWASDQVSGCAGPSCQLELSHNTSSFYSSRPKYNSGINFL